MRPLEAHDPRSIGAYTVLGVLGQGGMGKVFLGQSWTGKRVAIKVIRSEIATDPVFRQRFAREVEAGRAISALYTAPIVDADTQAETPWFATTYIEGPSLEDEVGTSGPMSVPSVLILAAGLAEAFIAIHRAGLVHRDLKPSNVLLTKDGPCVIDFGIALIPDSTSITQGVIGTPAYMSPEHIAGEEVGPASDIYSIGATLAFAATGQGPLGQGTPHSLIAKLISGQLDTSAVPEALKPIIARCLARDARYRPTASDLLGLLAAAGATHPYTGWFSPSAAAPSVTPIPPISGPPLAVPLAGAVGSGLAAASPAPAAAPAPAAPGSPGFPAPAYPAAPAAAAGVPAPGQPPAGYPAASSSAPAPASGYPAPASGGPAPGYPASASGAPAPGYPASASGYPGSPAPGQAAPASGAPSGYPAPASGAPAGYPGSPAPGQAATNPAYPGTPGYPSSGAPAPGYPSSGAPAPGSPAGYPVSAAPGSPAGYPPPASAAPGQTWPYGTPQPPAPAPGYPAGAYAPGQATPGYGQPQQVGYPPYGAPVATKTSRKGLWITLGIVAALLICGGGIAGIVIVANSSNQLAGPTTPTNGPTQGPTPTPKGKLKLSAPTTLAGLTKSTDPALQSTADDLVDNLESKITGESQAVAAFYNDQANPGSRVVFIGITSDIVSPEGEVDDAFESFNREANFEISNIEEVPAGPLGGLAKCGDGKSGDVKVVMCSWGDHENLGLVLFFNRSVTESKDLMLRIRSGATSRE